MSEIPSQRGPKEEEILLTVQEAAGFLSLSIPTIYGLISKSEIPVMKRSKRCYFYKKDLISYLNQGRQKTRSEIASEAEKHVNKKRVINSKPIASNG